MFWKWWAYLDIILCLYSRRDSRWSRFLIEKWVKIRANKKSHNYRLSTTNSHNNDSVDKHARSKKIEKRLFPVHWVCELDVRAMYEIVIHTRTVQIAKCVRKYTIIVSLHAVPNLLTHCRSEISVCKVKLKKNKLKNIFKVSQLQLWLFFEPNKNDLCKTNYSN